jgi:hypothetical protein
MVNYISIIIAMAVSSMTNILGYNQNSVRSSWTKVNKNKNNNKNNITKSPLLYSMVNNLN